MVSKVQVSAVDLKPKHEKLLIFDSISTSAQARTMKGPSSYFVFGELVSLIMFESSDISLVVVKNNVHMCI
jgi:hypothetical protein